MESDKIHGKVAEILNSRQIVINRGSTHGVEVGMQFAVLNSRGLEVKDPDTGETIGSVDVPKVFVKVVRVDENLSVAGTFRKFVRPATGLGAMDVLADFRGRPRKEIIETLRASESPHAEEMGPEQSYIRIGDAVIQADDDEFAGWEFNPSQIT